MINKIYFATTNNNKIAEAKRTLSPLGIEVEMIDMEMIEGRDEDPKDIAADKARQAYTKLQQPIMVEDSGFFIEALGGVPDDSHKIFS